MRLVHSHSAIKTYEQCAYKYYRLRVKKDVKDDKTEVSAYGDRVHKTFEARIRDKTPLTSDVQQLEPVVQVIERVPEKKTYSEYQLAVNEQLKPSKWRAPDVWIRGKLDVLVLGQTDATIIDWKTGKRREEFLSFDQLELNALLVFSNFPTIEKVNTSYVWVRGNKSDPRAYQRSGANNLWGVVIARIRQIYRSLENDNWPARPSPLCKSCSVRPSCPYAQR